MNRVLLALSAFVFLFSACKKVDEPTSPQDDLRSGTWIRTSGKVNYKDPFTRGDSIKNSVDSSLTCRFDNYLTFSTNNLGSVLLGSAKCSPGEGDSKPFTWEMTPDGSHISMYGVQDFFFADNVDAEVLTRTLGYLTLRYTVIQPDPIFHTADTLVYTDVLRKL